MNAKNSTLAVVLTFLAAVPLFAQQAEPPATAPAAVAPAPQQDATPANAPTQAGPAHVSGSLASIGDGRIELMVRKAFGPSAESAGVLVGQTVPFVLDAKTERPAELRVGEDLEVWFTEENGQGRATRIVAAEIAGDASTSVAAEPQGGAAPGPAPAAAEPPDATAQASKTAEGAVAAPAQPTGTLPPSATPAVNEPPKPTTPAAPPRVSAPVRHTKALVPPAPRAPAVPVPPETGASVTAEAPAPVVAQPPAASPEPQPSVEVSENVGTTGAGNTPPSATPQPVDPLRFIGIGAATMLAALALLYFTLRGRALEFGLGTGKGGGP